MARNDTFSGIGLERLEALVADKLQEAQKILVYDEQSSVLADHEQFLLSMSVGQIQRAYEVLRGSLSDDELVAVARLCDAFYQIGAVVRAPHKILSVKGKHTGALGGKAGGENRNKDLAKEWKDEALMLAQEFVQSNPAPKNFTVSRIAQFLEDTKAGSENKRSLDTYRRAVRGWIASRELLPVSQK